jgi:hypothetical protein
MITKFRIGAAGVALVSAFGLASVANAAASDTATAEANILAPLTLSADNSLHFGDIAVNGAGTVVVAADGSGASCSANLICTGGDSPADFTVTGSAGETVGIAYSNVVALSGPGANMTLSGLNADSGATLGLGAGTANFSVGGTLTVNAGQVAGYYSGSFDVTVEYQ